MPSGSPSRSPGRCYHGDLGEAGVAELQRCTAAELELIAGFLERGHALQLAQADRIRLLAVESAGQALP